MVGITIVAVGIGGGGGNVSSIGLFLFFQIAHKLLERYIKLRELGYPENLFTARPYLHCNISRENADKMVSELQYP